jgi:hypothetical protein
LPDSATRADTLLRIEIEKRRVVRRDIGLGVNAAVIAFQKLLLLQAITGERVVRITHRQPQRCLPALLIQLAEKLSHSRGRSGAPATFKKQRTSGVSMPAFAVCAPCSSSLVKRPKWDELLS